MIELTNINKSYQIGDDYLHVLRDVSLKVDQGEYISILGASGSGKSTLMNIIGCMDRLDSGSYTIDGTNVGGASDLQLAKIRNDKIGFIFQKYHLISKYSVLKNVMLPLLLRGYTSDQAYPKAMEMLELVGLAEKFSVKPNQLSGGQQQRVAIARALVTNPSLLLADEPTGALDSQTGKEILRLFERLNQRGHTIIQITHDQSVAKVANRVLTLIDGILYE